MRRRGVGAALYGMGDVNSAGQYPVGSIGDQYQTCIQAGGAPVDCAGAVISSNPLAGPGSASGAGLGTILLVGAAALFLGVMMSR